MWSDVYKKRRRRATSFEDDGKLEWHTLHIGKWRFRKCSGLQKTCQFLKWAPATILGKIDCLETFLNPRLCKNFSHKVNVLMLLHSLNSWKWNFYDAPWFFAFEEEREDFSLDSCGYRGHFGIGGMAVANGEAVHDFLCATDLPRVIIIFTRVTCALFHVPLSFTQLLHNPSLWSFESHRIRPVPDLSVQLDSFCT